ncbi:MAG TPA: hypothetical protein VGQ12_14780 [Candidatus Angelobacter sp.]|nr:hypothetical protein [Candidatus Angelobacter sp.]
MSKEEVIAAVLRCATNLGRVPTREELMTHGGVSRRDLSRNFGTLQQALRECKLERSSGNKKVDMENLFHDWARVARSLKKLPTMKEYGALSQYSVRPLKTRFVSWNFVPGGLKRFAEESGLVEEWKDVLALVNDAREPQPASPLTFAGPFAQTMPGQPTYGTPIQCGALVFAPTNEFGVLFLFGAIADRLGFLVLRVQAAFPDIEALRMVERDKLQRVRVELEQESRNFLRHGHDPNGCDLIVCWEHNWEECPLEVIELKTVIAKIAGTDRKNQNLTTEARRHGEQLRSEKAKSLTAD